MSGSGSGDRIAFEEQPQGGGGGPPTGPAGGDLSGTYPNPTVSNVSLGALPTNVRNANDLTSGAQAQLNALAARVAALEASSPVSTETAGSTLAIGRSVYRASTGKMLGEDASYAALRDSFAGFTTTAAAGDGSSVTVASNGARATGLAGITVGSGYYVSAGVLIAESALAAFVAGAASGTWYRFVGTGDSTSSIKQAWGEPQQVP